MGDHDNGCKYVFLNHLVIFISCIGLIQSNQITVLPYSQVDWELFVLWWAKGQTTHVLVMCTF